MKKSAFALKFLILSLILLGGGFPSRAAETPNTDFKNLLPVPSEVSWQNGNFTLDSNFTVIVQGPVESRVQSAVKRFKARLEKQTGLTFANQGTDPDNNTLLIEYVEKGLPVQSLREDESYVLIVSPRQSLLKAKNPLGILHGLQTFLQLVEKRDSGYALPSVTIHDQPRFAWRGLMIDACRHWQPVEVIERNLAGMEEAKLNVFHWHLSENQGFRVESKRFPKLQQLGSDGNFYTQDQIKAVVAEARQRGIRVIPEFDLPGHSTALLAAYPELGSAPGPYAIEKKFGVFDPTLDPSNEAAYQFADGFIGEMASLFPDEYFHIGGDEVNGKDWNQNPELQRFMYRNDLKTNDDLQAYFNSRLLKLVSKHGKKMVGWDEILNPNLPKTIVVQSWRGADALAESAKQGYDGILSHGYYLDLAQPASAHYVMDPLPAKTDLTAEQKSHVLGGEACMWSEFVSPETIDSRIWPRALAVAERLWSPASVQDLNDFYRRLEAESPRLEEVGLTHRSNYLLMLRRLAGDAPVEPLRVFADVVEPVKNYQRPRWGAYTSDYPLTRLVDAARPESDSARHFKSAVDQFLRTAPAYGNPEGLQASLKIWAGNHKALEPTLEKSDLLADTLSQSKDLSACAQVGLEAIQFLQSKHPAPADWISKSKALLDRAQKASAQVELAVVPAIRKLALAAGESDQLKEGGAQAWNQSLDTQIEAAKPKSNYW